MTIDEQLINSILEENEKRWVSLRADYNPITGFGAPGDREELYIPDFAIPHQYVPKTMFGNKFVKAVIASGSIEQFLKDYPNDARINTPHVVELELRRIRHKHDFLCWSYFTIKIKAKQGGRIRFKLNKAQLVVFMICEEMRLAGVPIDIIIVKARQWGGSTFCIFYQTWILFKWDPFHSFSVAAHLNTAAETIVKMLRKAVEDYPAWDLGLPENSSIHFAPAGKTGNSYVIKDDTGKNVFDAEIHVGSAENPDSLRAKDIAGVHYSELGVWPDTPQKRSSDLIADISGGILKVPLAMQVKESTAKSSDDYFHDEYVAAKKGQSNSKAVFIGWQLIAHDTLEIKDVKKFAEWLIKNKNNDTPDGQWKQPGKYYWYLWESGATLEGINWYRYKEKDFSTRGQMLNEAPSNDVEAFVAAGTHVFDVYQVEAMRKFCKEPIKIGRLISNDRKDKAVLQEIKFIEQSNGDLKIWEFPDRTPISNRYLVCVDIGGPNPTSDFHSVRVIDRIMMMPDFNGKPNVVAEMHYHCQRYQLAYDAMRLAEWYNHALLVIESNTYEMSDKNRDPGGDGSQYILDVAGELYGNLYCRETPPDKIIEGAPQRWGFHTGPDTKPKIIDLARWAISEQAWEEPCSNCLDEFAMYIEDHNKFTAPPKKHDDELMATCIGLWVCFKEMPLPQWVEQKHTKSTTGENNTMANF